MNRLLSLHSDMYLSRTMNNAKTGVRRVALAKLHFSARLLKRRGVAAHFGKAQGGGTGRSSTSWSASFLRADLHLSLDLDRNVKGQSGHADRGTGMLPNFKAEHFQNQI